MASTASATANATGDDQQQNARVHTSETIAEYVRQMRLLKDQAAAAAPDGTTSAISRAQFDEYVLKRFFGQQLRRERHVAEAASLASQSTRRNGPFVRPALLLLLAAAVPAMLLVCVPAWRQHCAALFMMHIQTLIYPGMSWWRTVTLPLLGAFPAMSGLYDESCLVANPLFHIPAMDCRPCADVHAVAQHREGPGPLVDDHRPLVFADQAQAPAVTVARLHELYVNHSQVYRLDAYAVTSTDARIRNLDDLFAAFGLGVNGTSNGGAAGDQLRPSRSFHALWRCNRMNPLRLLRTVIRRPSRLPRTGMHIERYVTVDTADAPAYRLPDMECARVFVAQLAGGRTMLLRPSGECADRCRTVSVRLQAGSVLLYDWWYWRPVSVPDPNQLGTSISYIGAYC